MRTRPAVLLLAAALLVALLPRCGAGAAPTPAPPSEVRTAEEAAAAVAAANPIFDGIGQLDPDLIGQGDFWEAVPRDAADPPGSWTVTFQLGWGDCQAGCINRHTWTYEVLRDGTVIFESEQGSPLEGGVLAQRLAASAVTGVGGRVHAGPVCPVEQPGDPACAPRSVAGATLVVRAADGSEVARFTTDASGLYRIELPPGRLHARGAAGRGADGDAGPAAVHGPGRGACPARRPVRHRDPLNGVPVRATG